MADDFVDNLLEFEHFVDRGLKFHHERETGIIKEMYKGMQNALLEWSLWRSLRY
jgi:hypothetical protein